VSYRDQYSTGASFRRVPEPNVLEIYDDWGLCYTIFAPANVIDTLTEECIANKIPERLRVAESEE